MCSRKIPIYPKAPDRADHRRREEPGRARLSALSLPWASESALKGAATGTARMGYSRLRNNVLKGHSQPPLLLREHGLRCHRKERVPELRGVFCIPEEGVIGVATHGGGEARVADICEPEVEWSGLHRIDQAEDIKPQNVRPCRKL